MMTMSDMVGVYWEEVDEIRGFVWID